MPVSFSTNSLCRQAQRHVSMLRTKRKYSTAVAKNAGTPQCLTCFEVGMCGMVLPAGGLVDWLQSAPSLSGGRALSVE